jgi:hypothetical protein
MAVKGKGKQVAAESPGPGAGGKRRKGSGDAEAGPSSSSAAKRRRRAGVLQFVDDAAGVDDDYEEDEVLQSEEEASDPDDGEYGFGAVPETRLASCVGVWIGWMDRSGFFGLCNVDYWIDYLGIYFFHLLCYLRLICVNCFFLGGGGWFPCLTTGTVRVL